MSKSNMKPRVCEVGYDGDKAVTVYFTETLNQEAKLAADLIERWGLVAAMPDGEDSAGRAKLRLPTADELVTRAMFIAERLWAMARERGHIVTLPDLNEVNVENDAVRAEESKRRAETRKAKAEARQS